MRDPVRGSAHVAFVAMLFCAAGGRVTATDADQVSTPLESASPASRHVGEREDLKQLALVKAGASKAVVRFGAGALEIISVGDRLGRGKAEVKEISAGRLVVEETFTGRDGGTNTAQIILNDGETGGKRYLRRLDEPPPPPATRPLIVPEPKLPNPEGR